jgi:hypothetical protein
MNKLTLNQITDVFKQIADSHEQIKTFSNYSMDELKVRELIYPVLHFHCDDCVIKNNEISYTCNVILLDRVNKDLTNREDVFSDMLQVAADIKTYLQAQNGNTFPLRIEPEAQIFKTNFITNNDNCVGWNLQLKVKANYNNRPCQIPFANELTPFHSSVSSGGSASLPFLTCDNILSCTTLTNYIQSHSSTGSTFSLPYKVYSFLLTQDGSTSAPTAITLENTLGNNISWVYDSTGSYILSASTNLFTINKTMVLMQSIPNGYHIDENTYITSAANSSASQIPFQVGTSGGGAGDLGFSKHQVELRVYN